MDDRYKVCRMCGRRLGFFDPKRKLIDGAVCAACWSYAGYTALEEEWAPRMTYADFIQNAPRGKKLPDA